MDLISSTLSTVFALARQRAQATHLQAAALDKLLTESRLPLRPVVFQAAKRTRAALKAGRALSRRRLFVGGA